jgi:hypothetical protein
VAVTEYRIDQDHGARPALDSLPDRGSEGLYSPDELTELIETSRLAPAAPELCLTPDEGRLDLTRHVQSQGVTYLELERALAPGEIGNLLISSDKQTLTWDSASEGAGPSTVHDLVRGSLAELPVGAGASETCPASGILEDRYQDPERPANGTGFWYVVRGRNVCGTGSYGRDSAGAERTTDACP